MAASSFTLSTPSGRYFCIFILFSVLLLVSVGAAAVKQDEAKAEKKACPRGAANNANCQDEGDDDEGTSSGIEVTVNSTVDSVVLYRNGAQITRHATAEVGVGVNRIKILGVPSTVAQDGVQLVVRGEGSILGLEFGNETQTKTGNMTELQAAVDEASEALSTVTEKFKVKQDVVNWRQKIADAVMKAQTAAPCKAGEVPATSINQMSVEDVVTFHEKYLTDAQNELAVVQKEKKEKEIALMTAKERLHAVTFAAPTIDHVAVALVKSESEGEIDLWVSYLLPDSEAEWRPSYEVRVEGKELSIVYNAQVKQWSGEDWTDVQLVLSTAQPGVRVDQVGFTGRWVLGQHQERQHAYVYRGQSKRQFMPQASASNIYSNVAPEGFYKSSEDAADVDLEMASSVAGAQTQLTTVVYTPSGRHSVRSSSVHGQQHVQRVTVAVETFEPKFKCSAIPRLQTIAFLKAHFKNNSPYTFLEGNAHVFINGSLVHRMRLPYTPSGEAVEAALGPDPFMQVQHRVQRKETAVKSLAVFNADRTRILFKHTMTLRNLKDTVQTTELKDQLPMTENERFSIKMIQPSEDQKNVKISEEKVVTWTIDVPPRKAVDVIFEYEIEFPTNERPNFLP